MFPIVLKDLLQGTGMHEGAVKEGLLLDGAWIHNILGRHWIDLSDKTIDSAQERRSRWRRVESKRETFNICEEVARQPRMTLPASKRWDP